jgi:multidrug efflux pump subunit AcrB
MMRRIFEFFAARHRLATLITIMVLLLGVHSIRVLRRDIFPRLDLAQIDIRTNYPGAAPEDVELNVTNKIEDALKEVEGIDRVISTSFENHSEITLFLDTDVKNLDRVKQNVRDAVAGVTDLPAEVTERPEVDELTTDNLPLMEIGISGDIPYGELREIAKRLKKKLLNIDGISGTLSNGYRAREVKVEVSPEALQHYQIPLTQIVQAISEGNIRQTGGIFESYTSEKNVVTLAQFRTPTDVGDVIVRSGFEGPQIRVRDLAVVREDYEEESILSRVNGVKAVSFLVYKKEKADAIRTAEAIKRMIREEAGEFVPGSPPEETVRGQGILESVKDFFVTNFLQSKREGQSTVQYESVQVSYANEVAPYVKNRFQIVLSNGAIGLLLVLILLTVFLNLRTAFWVAVGIPVSILGVCIFLPVFDSFLDSITLTSMILVIGIIVDDGIIISDNVSRHREMGKPPLKAAVDGLGEVFFPVLTTVLTTILAFLPMFFMTGMMGQFVFVIPLTVCLSLLISLSESVIALPAHLVKGMEKERGAHGGVRRRMVRGWFNLLCALYRRICFHLLKARYLLIILFVAVFTGVIWYATRQMDFILFPAKGADRFFINVELPMGSSLESTLEKVKEIEHIVSRLPQEELESYITRIGIAGWPPIGQAENYGMVIVRLTPYSERRRNADQIVEDIRAQSKTLKGYEQIIFDIDTGGLPVGKPVNLKIVGANDELRAKLADIVQSYLASAAGVKDINRDDIQGKDQLEINVDFSQLARFGLTASDVARTVRVAYDGELVTSMRDGDEDLKFRVQLQKKVRQDERFLRGLLIPNAQGRLIPLWRIAQLRTSPGPNSFRHFQGERAITITADVDTDITTAVEVTSGVLAHFDLAGDWPEMSIFVGGEVQESEEVMIDISVTFVIALLGIYFLLVLLFDSFTQPLLVLVAVPFGFVGVILTLKLHHEPLGFLSVVGIVGLVGVVVNDSLVLVSHLNEQIKHKAQKSGRASRKRIMEIVAEGTADRLRAVLLTTLTTAAGMLPLAYGLGGYDLYMAPMALVLGYGLLFATPLTLILVPCLYVIGDDIANLFKRPKPAAE